jgi:hypothetical protein
MPRHIAIALACLALIGVTLWPSGTSAAQPTPDPEPIGYSQGGLPLMLHRLGTGPRTVLLLGAQHGGPEANTHRLAEALLEHFRANPAEIPPSVTLAIMPAANPDGLVAGTRRFLSGVDPNRNWGPPGWEPDGWDSNGRFEVGLGGPEPMSEQETRALAAWVLTNRPTLVINYHSAGGFMFGGGTGLAADMAEAYERASGYYRPQPGGGGQRLLNYRVTGSMNVWLREQGIAGILIELTNPWDPEISRNLAGVRAVLAVIHGQ